MPALYTKSSARNEVWRPWTACCYSVHSNKHNIKPNQCHINRITGWPYSIYFFKIVIHLHKCRGYKGVLVVQHHMRMVTQVEGFHTLCSLLPASSSCRSLAFNSSLVLCLICSWRSADSCSFSSFIAEILDFSSRTTRSVSYRNKKQKYTKFKFKNADKGALE